MLHVLPEGWRDDQPPGDCRLIGLADLGRVRTLSPEVADEVETPLAAGTEVGAAFRDGVPVSLCYACAVTEGLWDVSVDTAVIHRRRGFASQAARFMIDRYARTGRRPVWGSAESNPASTGLARRLGFVPADVIWVLTPPG